MDSLSYIKIEVDLESFNNIYNILKYPTGVPEI